MIRLLSEESIEEGIYSIAQEKLRLEQDLTAEEEEGGNEVVKRRAKRDVTRLLKIALDVDLSEQDVGDVDKVVYTEL